MGCLLRTLYNKKDLMSLKCFYLLDTYLAFVCVEMRWHYLSDKSKTPKRLRRTVSNTQFELKFVYNMNVHNFATNP